MALNFNTVPGGLTGDRIDWLVAIESYVHRTRWGRPVSLNKTRIKPVTGQSQNGRIAQGIPTDTAYEQWPCSKSVQVNRYVRRGASQFRASCKYIPKQLSPTYERLRKLRGRFAAHFGSIDVQRLSAPSLI